VKVELPVYLGSVLRVHPVQTNQSGDPDSDHNSEKKFAWLEKQCKAKNRRLVLQSQIPD
jgi:hypothetical protein